MNEPQITSTYCFVTNRCNFDCSYCYEENRTGDMTKETMKRVVDYLVEEHKKHSLSSNEKSKISLTFFGGEPLLNWEVVKYGIEYALTFDEQDMPFSFYILTNGSVWTQEIHDYLKALYAKLKHRLVMQISMDGCEASHDKTRIFNSGKGTFKKVVENAKKYREIFPILILRETLVPENIDSWIEDYKCLSSISNTVSFTPIVEADWNAVLDKAPEAINTLFDMYEEQLENNCSQTFSLLNGNLASKFRESVSYRGCHAGKHLVGITIDGDIYPCHRFLSYRHLFDYKMGNIWDGIDIDSPKTQEVTTMHMKNDVCNACDSFSCNKCYATNMTLNKNLVDRPATGYCEFVRIVQEEVDKRADRIFFNSKWTLQEGNCYKSPTTKRRGIQMENGKRLFGEDSEDLMIQAASKSLKVLHSIEHQNETIIKLLKSLVKEKTDDSQT